MPSCRINIAHGQRTEIVLGAHLMNDPTFKLPSKVKEKNAASDVSSDKTDCNISASDEGIEKAYCCIQSLLEVVTV